MESWAEWRVFLYPLGFLSSLLFGLRGIVQWLYSEVKRESVVTAAFWHLSFAGNVLLLVHAFIQVQWHICIVQAFNGVIAWRNLNLMQSEDRQASLKKTLVILISSLLAVTVAFLLQSIWLLNGEIEWVRIPVTPWMSDRVVTASMLWHVVGFIGITLFASRFWIQWWCIERYKRSYLGKTFWWLSLFGALLSLSYFIFIGDVVGFLGPAVGIVPYIRNLMLMYRQKKSDPALYPSKP